MKVLHVLILVLIAGCNEIPKSEKKVNVAEPFSVIKSPDTTTLEGEDDFLNKKVFGRWKGKYLANESTVDGWERNSKMIISIDLIRPDSSVLEFWLADTNSEKYSENSNYTKIVGQIYEGNGTSDSISFYLKDFISGEMEGYSTPLFKLHNERGLYKNFSLESQLVSPTRNGQTKVMIDKIE